MRKAAFLAIVFMTTLHFAKAQKIELVTADDTVEVKLISKADTNKYDTSHITLSFKLSQNQPSDSLRFKLRIDSSNSPAAFVKWDNEIAFGKNEWPTNHTDNLVKRTISIITRRVATFLQEDRIKIYLDTSKSGGAILGAADNGVLIHFNLAGSAAHTTVLSYLTDTSNTLKTDFAFYTDFAGVDDDKPNGLFQAELGFKVPLNRSKTIASHDTSHHTFLQPFRSVYTSLNLLSLENLTTSDVNKSSARLKTLDDSSFVVGFDTTITKDSTGASDTTFIKQYAQRKLVNTFDLYRWASFAFKVKLNILSFRSDFHHFYIDYTVGILRTPIFDSIQNQRVFATSFIQGPGIFYETNFIHGAPLFNLRATANYYLIKVLGNDFEQINAPIIEENTKSKYTNVFKSVSWGKMGEVSLRLSWLYNAKDADANKNNNIFVRGGLAFQEPEIDGKKFFNKYFQFQVGGVFDINSLFKAPPAMTSGDQTH